MQTNHGSATTLEKEQADTLSSALKFTQTKHIAYFTRSNLDRENSDLVDKVMKDHAKDVEDMGIEQEWTGFELDQELSFQHKGIYIVLFIMLIN